MNVRRHDMSEWRGKTWRCATLKEALAVAEYNLEATLQVSIWPMPGWWLVITYISSLAN